jgi:metal-responsive CopG/Arc/MetJ family transcriptional regulator
MDMKTAISIPDDTFNRASLRAENLGMSRSEFFARAAARYLDELDSESVTQQVNDAIAGLAEEDDSSTYAALVGHRLLDQASEDW